jgi:hypothetical protein
MTDCIKGANAMKLFYAFILTLFLCGCYSTRCDVAPDQQRSAFTDEVLVYDRSVPDSVQYAIIGNFVIEKRWYGGTEGTAKHAADEAAVKGANGILILRSGHRWTIWAYAAPYTEGSLLWIENYHQAKAAMRNGPGKLGQKDNAPTHKPVKYQKAKVQQEESDEDTAPTPPPKPKKVQKPVKAQQEDAEEDAAPPPPPKPKKVPKPVKVQQDDEEEDATPPPPKPKKAPKPTVIQPDDSE